MLRFLADEKSAAAILIISGVDSKTIASANDLGNAHGLRMIGFMQKPMAVAELRVALKGALDAQRSITADSLSAAIATGQLAVYYQPKATRNILDKNAVPSTG